MALTDQECKKAQPSDKQYRLSDANGLSLIISPKGQKYWNIRVTVHGQRKSESLGQYPDISLKKAREIALELKYKYSRSAIHEELKPFFRDVAEEWFEKNVVNDGDLDFLDKLNNLIDQVAAIARM